MIKKILISFITIFLTYELYGQCPTTDFNVPTEVCIDEIVDIENLSDPGETYFWDFCVGDLSEVPVATNLLTLSNSSEPRGIEIVFDGSEWFGFVTNLSNSVIHRLEFGNSITNTPTVVELGNIDGLLDGPEPIKILNEGGNWYALIHNSGNQTLVKLSFGTSLGSTPTASVILSGIGNSGTTLDYGYSSNELIVVLANFAASNLTIVKLGSSVNNIPAPADYFTTAAVPGFSWFSDLSLIEDCGEWFGVSDGLFGKEAFLFKFGSSLFSTPIIEEIGTNIFSPNTPNRVWVGKDTNDYIMFGAMSNGNLHRINLGDDLNSVTSVNTNLGNLGLMNRTNSLKFVKEGSSWVAFSLDRLLSRLYRIEFPNNCPVSDLTSSEFEPKGLKFTSDGTYQIALTTTNSSGEKSSLSKSIIVKSSTAPDIEFNVTNVCLNSLTAFAGINNTPAQTITSWTWDFGDGSPTETGQNVSHLYATSGDYEVKLEVDSDNGCKQFVYENITIYDEPIPDFTVPPGVKCSNGSILFTNTTPGTFGGLITWTWDFDDGSPTSSDKDPTHVFTGSGTFNVKLTASIPGCSIDKIIPVTIEEGPIVNFTFADDCQNELIAFTNTTTGTGITGYHWDFDDGVQSTLQSPSHEFTTAGNYMVTLTVDNDKGCSVENSQLVTIHALPQVQFTNDLSCSGAETQFNDQTTVDDANITAWHWDFGDGSVSTDKDPKHTYGTASSYNVTLTTTSNYGCQSSLMKSVTVIPGPTVDFSNNAACFGEPTQFEDLSSDLGAETITSWYWEIDGNVFTNQHPAYTFPTADTYPVSLTITSSTFCTASVVKDVVINPQVQADFTFSNPCVDSEITFEDNSLFTGDVITSYDWDFAGQRSSTDAIPTHTFNEIGDHEVTLTIGTENGCTATLGKTLTIIEKPVAAFMTDFSQGSPPLVVTFTNNSVNAEQYLWDFDDPDNTTADIVSPIFTFNTSDSYDVRLIATHANGCADTTSKRINVVDPRLDLAVEDINLDQQGGKTRLFIDIRNLGNVYIDNIDINVDLGGRININEPLTRELAPGELLVYPLSVEILNQLSKTADYICIDLKVVNSLFTDADPVNNRQCINLNAKDNIIEPYPNPVSDEMRVAVVLEEEQKVQVMLYDSHGDAVMEREFPKSPAGLNEYLLDTRTISDGIYLMKVQYGTTQNVFKVFVNK